jgi:hypothetical protein
MPSMDAEWGYWKAKLFICRVINSTNTGGRGGSCPRGFDGCWSLLFLEMCWAKRADFMSAGQIFDDYYYKGRTIFLFLTCFKHEPVTILNQKSDIILRSIHFFESLRRLNDSFSLWWKHFLQFLHKTIWGDTVTSITTTWVVSRSGHNYCCNNRWPVFNILKEKRRLNFCLKCRFYGMRLGLSRSSKQI